jgi:hypothetical protein
MGSMRCPLSSGCGIGMHSHSRYVGNNTPSIRESKRKLKIAEFKVTRV